IAVTFGGIEGKSQKAVKAPSQHDDDERNAHQHAADVDSQRLDQLSPGRGGGGGAGNGTSHCDRLRLRFRLSRTRLGSFLREAEAEIRKEEDAYGYSNPEQWDVPFPAP